MFSLRLIAIIVTIAAALTMGRFTPLEASTSPKQAPIAGTMIDIGTLGGDTGANDINDSGQIVGEADTRAGESHAFLWTRKTGMRDLGTLGGPNSSAEYINHRGQVVGWSLTKAGDRHAFLWSPETGMRDLGTLGGDESQVWAINNAGHVVGYARTHEGYQHAFLWTPESGMKDLGTLGGNSSEALDINDVGQIVGMADDIRGNSHAFRWTPESGMEDLGTMGGRWSFATDISNTGLIIGDSVNTNDEKGCRFLSSQDAGMQELGALIRPGYGTDITEPGQAWSTVINDHGQVAGAFSLRSQFYAFLLSLGTGVQQIGVLGDPGSGCGPMDINNAGQVVGLAETPDGISMYAFLWAPGRGMQNIGTLGGWSQARAINDAGQVTGNSETKDGNIHAFLWTPKK